MKAQPTRSARSRAADHLRGVLSLAAQHDAQAASLAEQLLRLLDQALAETELHARREVARRLPHELGQPLSELLGYAELLAEHDYAPDEQSDLVRRIAAAADRLGKLVHALAAQANTEQASDDALEAELRPTATPTEELRRAASQHLQC